MHGADPSANILPSDPPVSYHELLDGLKTVTQALSDVVGQGGGPYDHLISDLDYAKDLIGRSSK